MSEKKVIENCLPSEEDTDSSDEAFVFTRKRKAISFFIDLTEGESDCKKKKTENDNENDQCPKLDEGPAEQISGKAAPEPELEMRK